MKIHRFFINFDFKEKLIKIENHELANQIKNVLRLKIGDTIVLCNGQNQEAECLILNISDKKMELEILKLFKNQNEPESEVTLYCSILKRENFEWVVQKAVEVGIKKIIPLICARTIKLNLKTERFHKIIREAAEQSGRGILSEITEPQNFNAAVIALEENQINLFFDLNGQNFDQIKSKTANFKKIGIFIGPEGGWDKDEQGLAEKNNFLSVKLSNLTLRAETAAVIASYLSVYL